MAANDPSPYRFRRPGLIWWLWALAIAVAVVIAALAVKRLTDGGNGKGGRTTSAPRAATTGAIGSAPGGTQAGGPGTLRAGARSLLALAKGGGSLASAAGAGRVEARGVRVDERVDDTGFWVGPSRAERVFVEVEQKGLAQVELAAGNHVSFNGTLERNIEAETYGLRAGQGAGRFRAQRYHVKVQASQLTVE